MFKHRILNNVFVGGIVDAVEHHLVEQNCIVEEEKGASDKIFEYDEFVNLSFSYSSKRSSYFFFQLFIF